MPEPPAGGGYFVEPGQIEFGQGIRQFLPGISGMGNGLVIHDPDAGTAVSSSSVFFNLNQRNSGRAKADAHCDGFFRDFSFRHFQYPDDFSTE
jgi:hypothetical protein